MSYDEEIPVRTFDDDPHVYISVYNRGTHWYYYNPDSSPLGEGAMGRVFLGYDYNDNKKVAIKQLYDRFAKAKTVRERARLEASLSYSHPNLVEMLGCCQYEDEDGYWHVWVLSNYVNGQNIDKYIKSQPQLSQVERVEIIIKCTLSILDALDYLHSKGVIHRDIKPSNIMVDQNGVVKLMDLGVARMNGANMYTSNGFVGTPLYAPPEQILRDKLQVQVSPSSDFYSLGVTMYVLINGDNPFNADTDAQILANQITKKLPATDKLPKRYRRLMNVIWKATEKNQSDRYLTAAEFKHAIEIAINPNPTPWWYYVVGGLLVTIIISILLIAFVL